MNRAFGRLKQSFVLVETEVFVITYESSLRATETKTKNKAIRIHIELPMNRAFGRLKLSNNPLGPNIRLKITYESSLRATETGMFTVVVTRLDVITYESSLRATETHQPLLFFRLICNYL